ALQTPVERRDTGQCRCAGAGVDAFDSLDNSRGQNRKVWREHALRASCTTGGTRSALRFSRLLGSFLCHRGSLWSHGRKDPALTNLKAEAAPAEESRAARVRRLRRI